ncbi:MAG: hypothetical protein R3293_25580 [Candidatus Promineifilaceae bacterium]|nr:hypothetical protein [Candidatus Promineifilaceae bacterium]
MDLIETILKATLYRYDCPSNMELGEFELGLLETTERGDEIAAHAAKCPHCLADLSQIRQYMALPLVDNFLADSAQEKKTPLLEKAKVVIIDLLSPPRDFQMNKQLQPALRGSQGDMETHVFQVESYVIALSAVKDISAWQKQQIIGDISAIVDNDENFQRWSAYLWRDGKLLATTAINRDSHFVFDSVQFANRPHELILSGPKVEIHLQNLQMA